MVDRALIRAKVQYGLGKAGTILGYTVNQYRPSGASSPIGSGTLVGSITADFDVAAALQFKSQQVFDKAALYLLGNPATLLTGDYLVGQGSGPDEGWTYFVAACGGVAPALVIRCNAVLTISRAPAPVAGIGGYGGETAANLVPVLTGWPAALLPKGRSESNATRLPADGKLPLIEILLPWGGVMPNNADVVVDDAGRRYVVSLVNRQPQGLHLAAVLVAA
jgi:hypothetical protein